MLPKIVLKLGRWYRKRKLHNKAAGVAVGVAYDLAHSPGHEQVKATHAEHHEQAVPGGTGKANRKRPRPSAPLHGINGSIHRVMRRGAASPRPAPAMDTVLLHTGTPSSEGWRISVDAQTAEEGIHEVHTTPAR